MNRRPINLSNGAQRLTKHARSAPRVRMSVYPTDQYVFPIMHGLENMSVSEIEQLRVCRRVSPFPKKKSFNVCDILRGACFRLYETETFQTPTTYGMRHDYGIGDVVKLCVELPAATLTNPDVYRARGHRPRLGKSGAAVASFAAAIPSDACLGGSQSGLCSWTSGFAPRKAWAIRLPGRFGSLR